MFLAFTAEPYAIQKNIIARLSNVHWGLTLRAGSCFVEKARFTESED
jgi:hypothetical protein